MEKGATGGAVRAKEVMGRAEGGKGKNLVTGDLVAVGLVVTVELNRGGMGDEEMEMVGVVVRGAVDAEMAEKGAEVWAGMGMEVN